MIFLICFVFRISVLFSKFELLKTSVLIYNITGSKVFEKELTTGLTRIDLTDFPSGIYTIQAGFKIKRLIAW